MPYDHITISDARCIRLDNTDWQCENCHFWYGKNVNKDGHKNSGSCAKNLKLEESVEYKYDPDKVIDLKAPEVSPSGVLCPVENCNVRVMSFKGLHTHARNVHTTSDYIKIRRTHFEEAGLDWQCPTCFVYFEVPNSYHKCSEYVSMAKTAGLPMDIRGSYRSEGKFKCPIPGCMGRYLSYQILHMHGRDKHTKADYIKIRQTYFEGATWRCEKCLCWFEGQSNKHHNPKMCERYQKISSQSKSDDKCLSLPASTESVTKSGQSGSLALTFDTVGPIQQVRSAKGGGDYSCPVEDCQKTFHHHFSAYSHIKEKHGIMEFVKFRRARHWHCNARCSQCNFYFAKNFHKPEDCKKYAEMVIECGFEIEEVVSEPESKTPEPSPKQKSALAKYSSPVKKEPGPCVKYECHKCKSVFDKKHYLYSHCRKMHGKTAYLAARRTKFPGLNWKCDDCQFWFGDRRKCIKEKCLENQKQTRGTKYEGLDSEADPSMAESLPNTKLRMFSYQCPHCDKSGSLGAIYDHLKTIHGRDAYVGYRLSKIPQWQDQQCEDCEWYFCGLVGAHNCNRNQIDRLNYLESEASKPETTEVVPSSKSFVAGEFEYKCQG